MMSAETVEIDTSARRATSCIVCLLGRDDGGRRRGVEKQVCGGWRAELRAAIVARWGSKRYELETYLSTRGRNVAVDAGRLCGPDAQQLASLTTDSHWTHAGLRCSNNT